MMLPIPPTRLSGPLALWDKYRRVPVPVSPRSESTLNFLVAWKDSCRTDHNMHAGLEKRGRGG